MTDIGPSQMKMSDGCPGIFKAPGSSMIRQLQPEWRSKTVDQREWVLGQSPSLYETLFAESLDKRFNQWLNTLGEISDESRNRFNRRFCISSAACPYMKMNCLNNFRCRHYTFRPHLFLTKMIQSPLTRKRTV